LETYPNFQSRGGINLPLLFFYANMRKGGRAKGTPNKLSSDVKKLLLDAIEKHFVSDLNKLTPDKRIDVLIKILPYILPINKVDSDEVGHKTIMVLRAAEPTTIKTPDGKKINLE
jgi:hypothetical protein